MDWDIEQQAVAILDEADEGGRSVRVEAIAHRLGLTIRDGGRGCEGLLFGHEIIVDESLPKPMWNFTVGHEIGHFDSQRKGLPDSEWRANYLSSAMQMPLEFVKLDLRELGWDLLALLARYRHASGEAIARRVGTVREARVFVFDRPQGRRPRSYGVPRRLRITRAEREAVDLAFDTGAPAEPYAGVAAWPLFKEGWRRVIAISDHESVQCVPG